MQPLVLMCRWVCVWRFRCGECVLPVGVRARVARGLCAATGLRGGRTGYFTLPVADSTRFRPTLAQHLLRLLSSVRTSRATSRRRRAPGGRACSSAGARLRPAPSSVIVDALPASRKTKLSTLVSSAFRHRRCCRLGSHAVQRERHGACAREVSARRAARPSARRGGARREALR